LNCRIGHHSTSDDSSAYRSLDEISYWEQEGNPTKKLEAYLIQQGYWTSEQTEQMLKSKRKEVCNAHTDWLKLRPSHNMWSLSLFLYIFISL